MLGLRGRYPAALVLLFSLVFAAFLGVTDFLTGFELSFSIFYLLPITAATAAAGRAEGIAVGIVSAAAWLIADLASGHHYSNALIPYWNSVVRLGYFVLHTTLLDQLLTALKHQEDLSGRDALTGAANLRRLEERARLELERARRSRRPLTFCYIDLDNFKAVNDTLGHETGDELLRTIVELMQRRVRPTDLVARVGGDEFALLLPESPYDPAHVVLDRVRAEILAEMKRRAWPVTLSVGALTCETVPPGLDAMVKRADSLMYEVKRSGKNGLRHVVWPTGGGLRAG